MKPWKTDPRLVLKATPPRVQKAAVARPRLASEVPELADKSLIFVQAPAGFGKTSLLAQWRREALQRGGIVAWLTLDQDDDESRLAAGVCLAMRMGSGRAGFGEETAIGLDQGGSIHEGLTGWLAEVASMAAAAVLILDEVHTLPLPTLEALGYLLHNAPANLKVILASRAPIGLGQSDWVAHGQLASLGTDDLRLRLPETMAILAGRFGTRIAPDDCARLQDLTDGWPLGLQLAVSAIEKSTSLREAINALSACSGDMRRYFVESLVDRLPTRLAHFMVRFSFLDALHPELCRAVSPDQDSAEILARLRDVTPIFTQGVGSDWYRIHPLAREFLRDRFMALPHDERRELHARAAAWLAEHDMHEAAARHCLAAGQIQLAYELAERGLYEILIGGQVARVVEWVDQLPAEEVQRRPRLRLTAGWLLALSDRHGEAVRMVGSIADDAAAQSDHRCESAAICSAAAFFADDLASVERIITPWLDSLPTRPELLQTIVGNQVAALMQYHGSPEQARHYCQRLSQLAVPGDSGYVRSWRDWQIGTSHLWEGQVALAEEALHASLGRAEEQSGRRSPVAVMLSSALAAALWDADRPDEAAIVLANRLDVLERRATPDAVIMGIVTAARLAAVGGLERRAFDLLDNLHALGVSRDLPRLCIASLTEQIRMNALRSRAEACATLLDRLDAVPVEAARQRWGALGELVDIQLQLARAYAAIVRSDWKAVLAAADAARRIASRLRRGRDAIQSQLLRALALRRCGENGDALLLEATSLAESFGLNRILADTHPDLADWARRLHASEAPTPAALPGATEAPKRPPPLPVRPARAQVSPSALLTGKEREVLQLLAGNMSNKQIALALCIGDTTVKWHLKNLFGKLNASNRKHVLDRARMLGILDSAA